MSLISKFNILCITIVLLISFSTVGCSAPQQYYKNLHYTGNVQAHFNRDEQRCEAIARQARPNVPIYLPKGPTTTQGKVFVFDNHGNSAHGTYQSTTYPNRTENLLGMLDSLTQTVNASNIYLAVKNQCLAELGWYLISKKEYMQSQPRPKKQKEAPVTNTRKRLQENAPKKSFWNKSQEDTPITGTWGWIEENAPSKSTWGGSIKVKSVPSTLEGTGGKGGGYIQISSQPSGAKILVRKYLEQQYETVSEVTPLNVPLPPNNNRWQPECYKAILNGIESEEVCFEDLDYRRTVNFIFK
ncbi:MAG: hypothetical protein R3Y11_08500 [Pseudomonadota bacterium]